MATPTITDTKKQEPITGFTPGLTREQRLELQRNALLKTEAAHLSEISRLKQALEEIAELGDADAERYLNKAFRTYSVIAREALTSIPLEKT